MTQKSVGAKSSVAEGIKRVVPNNVTQGMALIYGVCMMTWPGFNQVSSTYWAFFLTDVCGLPADTMANIKVWSGIGDWIFVILVAIIVERVWFRWGQYRSYLLLGPPLAFVCLLMTFIDPVFLDAAGKAVWMGAFYILGNFFAAIFIVAGVSIVPTISKNEHDRMLLSTRKSQGNMFIKVFFASLSLPMILLFNGGNTDGATGYTATAFIWGAFMVIMFLVLFFRIKGMDPTEEYCRERAKARKEGKKLDREQMEAAPQKVNLLKMVKYWITNVPALIALVTESIRFIAQMTITGMAMYFFLYVYNDVAMVAVMLTAANATGLVATFVAELFTKKLSGRTVYAIGIAIASISMFIGYLVGAHDKWFFTACICACYFGMNFMNATLVGIQSNAIAYGEWRNGIVGKGFIMATFQWTPRIGVIASSALYGFGLAALGFTKGMEATPEIAQGMVNIICLIPGVLFAIAFVLFILFYRLGRSKMDTISADLEERHEARKEKEEQADAQADGKNGSAANATGAEPAAGDEAGEERT